MAGTLFFYFGDDEAYFKTLQGEFKRHSRMSIDFKRLYEKDEKKIQSLFLKIYKLKPACVFIDFSKETQDYLHLARVIARTPLEHKMVTVGLVDYLSPPEVLKESIATGAHLTHIKSAESFDVVFDVIRLLSPNEMGEHGFAKASLKETMDAGVPIKIGFVHQEGLHFETDHALKKGDRIRINHHWTEKKIVPSKEIFIQDVQTKNLFYQFKYGVDAEFLFIDEFLPPEGMEPERIEEKKKERDEFIIYHRKQLSKWIEDNLSRSLEKKAKVLVIDREFHFYQDQPRTDKHPYTIRCVPYLEDIGTELDRLEPQFIAYAVEDGQGAKNSLENLSQIINVVKNKFADSSPFFVVFNTKSTSKELQEANKYAHIMATDHELSVDLLVRMADVFEKKMSTLTQNVAAPSKAKPQKKVFMKKNNPASISEVLIPVTIMKLSETDMVFQSEIELPIGMNLHFLNPVDMFVNVQPTKNQGKVPEYHGLIHGIGEEAKKELRRYVNSVFFRDHDAQVEAETEEFKKLNEAKLQEKEDAKKREEELASTASTEETKTPEETES